MTAIKMATKIFFFLQWKAFFGCNYKDKNLLLIGVKNYVCVLFVSVCVCVVMCVSMWNKN